MDSFSEMHLSAYRRTPDKRHPDGETMVTLHANGVLVGDTDPDKYASDVGIKYLSFFMTADEFVGLMEGKLSGCNDIGHNVRAVEDRFTFFDMEFSHERRGVLRVPYVELHVPYYVRIILLRAVRAAWKRAAPGGDNIKINLSLPLRQRWARQYGQGTGRVEVDVKHGVTEPFFAQCSEAGGESFARCIKSLRQIAVNSTARHTDLGTVYLSKDWDGFYFRVFGPHGRCTLNGGLINHGRDGEPSWSLHT